MFLTSPFIDQAITRFHRWSMSDIAMFQQLRSFSTALEGRSHADNVANDIRRCRCAKLVEPYITPELKTATTLTP